MAPELKEFIAACLRLRPRDDWPTAVAAAMRDLFNSPLLVEKVRAEIDGVLVAKVARLLSSESLTIYAIDSDGGLRGPPHDHYTPAVVGLIAGVEQFKLYRRENGHCVQTGMVRVDAPSVTTMDESTVHALWNDPSHGGLSLHVYGNSHFDEPRRRMWHPTTLEEMPFNFEKQLQWTRELSVRADAAI